ncbi:Fanconi anemia group I protein homolog [Drosophila bipectinata]|uniref:Fanconi anemia group I protein homolog n=1 Tax=Drosophila bipectinata TaxID=42026 RepID=UPI001C8928E6|nr:Fanconi anemia group I protein homolog [Drosophila bipectinata]
MGQDSILQWVRKLGEKGPRSELELLIQNTPTKKLIETLNETMARSEGITFWNYLLLGFVSNSEESRQKRFACVQSFMDGLRCVELSYKQTFDLITRLSQDLSTFPSEQLAWIVEHCVDGMRQGDAKCVGWKDLLPDALSLLLGRPRFVVNGIGLDGLEYRNNTVKTISTMQWPSTILTPIADMLKTMNLSNAELLTVLNKFSAALQELSPMELPALCFQLFSMCNSASQLIMPLLALEKYFHRNFYKRLFSDMCSNSTNFDSIDSFSDNELREAEETILHHLNYCTMYKLNEQNLVIMLRNFSHMPDVVLTPFMLSAIISMTSINRDPESARNSHSILLPFLRNVINNNEEERTLADYSVWYRDTLQRKQVDLQQVFNVLIDQNKDGKDVITPGLVHLVFSLLKSHSTKLHTLAITFLTKFIRKRFIFGQGIIKLVSEWMIVFQDQNQFSECLTLLSVADTFTVSECSKTIETVLEHMQWLSGEQAMRMMNFILPLLKISNRVRDALIDVLCKAMSSSCIQKRRMAIYGFCMILKQLNNSNAARQTSSATSYCTQHSISGYSMMSQSTFGSRSNPQRNFDMLTLEIIGLLRNCLQQQFEIRCTLYENLQRAVELNAKLVIHVLQVIDWHFRSFFDTPSEEDVLDNLDTVFRIRYDNLVSANDDQHMEIQLKDNLGRLIQFVGNCLAIFERAPTGYDAREMNRLLNLCVQRMVDNRLPLEDTSPPATHLKCALVLQQMNIIEGIISHLLLSSKPSNEQISHILPLFKMHTKLTENHKALAGASKKAHKQSKQGTNTESSNITLNGVQVKNICPQPENIWDLTILEKLLHLLLDDVVAFAAPEKTVLLRSHQPLVQYVLQICAKKVQSIRQEPDYKQLSYSKRTLKQLTDITKVIYERCIRRLPELWKNFDMQSSALAAECFMECLRTAHEIYPKKFSDFVKGFDMATLTKNKESVLVIQDVLDAFMEEYGSDESICKDEFVAKLPIWLFEALEIMLDHIQYDERLATDSYTWLLNFCCNNEILNADMGLVHRILFVQRQKTHLGPFFDNIAKQLGSVLGALNDDVPVDSVGPNLKSISIVTVESCLQHLYTAVQKQLADVDYFVTKANNLNYKCQIVPESDQIYWRGNLDVMDRSICTRIIHISRTLLALTNVCIPLGASMDGLLKLLIQLYTCMKNLTKHFLSCCSSDPSNTSIRNTKFELLLRDVGKQLPTNIYELINYIEANAIDEEAQQHLKKRKVQAERAKVLRETRMIPKVIMVIEDFNKHIILLSKKTKAQNRLTDYLHFGTMRDFDIKSTDLKAAIERSISDGRNISVDESHAEEDEDDDAQSCTYPEEVEDDEDEPVQVEEKSQRRRRVLSTDSEEAQPKRKRGRKPAEKPKSPVPANDVEEEAPSSLKTVRSKKDKKKPTRPVQEEVNSDGEEPVSTSKPARSKKDKKKPTRQKDMNIDGEEPPAKKTRASRTRPSVEELISDEDEQPAERPESSRASVEVLESDEEEQPAKKTRASRTRPSIEELGSDDEELPVKNTRASRARTSVDEMENNDQEQPAKKSRARGSRAPLEETNEDTSSKKAKETRKPIEPVAKEKPLIRVRLGLLRSGRSKLD